MVKQTKQQNTHANNKKNKKSKPKHTLLKINRPKRQQLKLKSDSTQLQPHFTQKISSKINPDASPQMPISTAQNSQAKVSPGERIKIINHLMWLIKKIPTLPFHSLAFKSTQYLDLYIQSLQVINTNTLKVAALASLLLACQQFNLKGIDLNKTIQTIYQFEFGVNQVLGVRQEITFLIETKRKPTIYESFKSTLDFLKSQNIQISKESLRKIHHYLRLFLLKYEVPQYFSEICIYYVSSLNKTDLSVKNKMNFIINNIKIDLQPTINFIRSLDEQFSQQKYIYLMVNQLKGVNLFE